MGTISTGLGVLLGLALLLVVVLLVVVTRLFRKVDQGQALIISKTKRVDVTFTGAIVLPVVHKAEVMDISVKTIEIERSGKEGLICRDNIRADIRIAFFVRVNKTAEDVVKVAQAIGTARASDETTLQTLFNAKFSEALKTVGKHLDFTDLYTQRHQFRDQIIAVIGTDLNGYSLEDAAIDYLEQTPLHQLDNSNILDAQGIRKITELTAIEHVRTNDYRRNEEKELTRQDVEAREAILELERRKADAESKQQREIETVRAREQAETDRVRAEERLKAQTASLRTDEQLGIQQENQAREIAVAAKNKERVIAIESERIEKDRQLEVIGRERETDLAKIAMVKELEVEKRSVAELIRDRIAVDRTVVEQEEQIKRVQALEAAERDRQALVIKAEAEAQQNLVKDIKAAEAAEQAAAHKAREQVVLAEARTQAADLETRATLRLAEGLQAEAAAAGLAEVQVREANADALEKQGRVEALIEKEKAVAAAEALERRGQAEALVARETGIADAEAAQKRGLAAAAVEREKGLASAEATEKLGLAEAAVAREKGLAGAEAAEKLGLAEAGVAREKGLAEAESARQRALADAEGLRAKLKGEAEGLTEKAAAMASLDGATREHEEFLRRLDAVREVQLAQLAAQQAVAESQAHVLATGLDKAKIDIVGVDGMFFDRLVGSISLGKSVDGFVQHSDVVQALGASWLDGNGSFTADLSRLVGGLDPAGIKDLTLSALLVKLIKDGGDKAKLTELLETTQKLGLADAPVAALTAR